MKKRKGAPKAAIAKKLDGAILTQNRKFPSIRFGVATFAVLLCSIIGAAATNNLYRGHVVVTQDQRKITLTSQSAVAKKAAKPPSLTQSATSGKPTDLIAKYGELAKSPLIAAAISKYELRSDSLIAAKFGTKLAADRSEALQHGYMMPGTSQTEILMAGYVPPGMSQEQAALLYAHLPHTPMMPQPMTPERIARMAGEPPDPMQAMMQEQGLSPSRISAENNRMIESYTRERFGPVYVPPMHADHAWLATHGRKTANGFVVDTHNQLSLIDPQYRYDGPIGPVGSGSIRDVTTSTGSVAAQYSYDPFGVQTRVSGTGPDSDFGFCGYYVHQPSGLLFTQTRAYSPVLGRFLNRDPAGELGSTNLYAYCENDPVNWVDPSGLWPLGLPGQDIAKKKLPPRLKKLFPCLTQNEADQLSNDIIKKLNYGDLGNAKPLINVNSPSDLSPDQSKWLQNFLNSLPTSDQPAIQKILPLLP